MNTRNKNITRVTDVCDYCNEKVEIIIEVGEILEYSHKDEEFWVEYIYTICTSCNGKDYY